MQPLTHNEAMEGDFVGMGEYLVTDIYYGIQSIGALAGMPMVFVQFAKCNLRCSVASAGFDCDTQFGRGDRYKRIGLLDAAEQAWQGPVFEDPSQVPADRPWLWCTGGEPALQVNRALIEVAHRRGWRVAIETNGTIELPEAIDYIRLSPKTAEHTLAQLKCDELLTVVRANAQAPALESIQATNRYLSPAFEADGGLSREAAQWAADLVLANPQWRLAVQSHKLLGIRG